METFPIYPGGSYTTYIAAGLYKQRLPMEMMRVVFPMMDSEREVLARDGPWTGRTDSLDRYAVVDTYA